MKRRAVLTGAAASALLPCAGRVAAAVILGPAVAFNADTLIERARALANGAYRAPPKVPRAWRDLSYETFRKIWFRSADALWQGTDRPLRVDLMPPGLYFHRAVRVHTVEGGHSREIAFDLNLFDRTDDFPDLPVDDSVGFSGIRLRAETVERGIFQEFAVFQGASYFRAIGRNEIYGLSARGLALDTAEARGEEFPDFTDFYLEAPMPGARVWRVHALLDSPSVAGAYSFDIRTDAATVMDVRATLFPRTRLEHVGLGPLTSMFLFDGKTPGRFDDFRPAVHDSDGLSIENGAGEVLWRPLNNPRKLQISSFVDTGPKGFGLMQRSRNYSDFADLEALYHRRPGVWIEPAEDWGPGAVTLVEIPTDREIYDNIVAYWRPRAPMAPRHPVKLAYRLTWERSEPERQPLSRVIGTRMGKHHPGVEDTGSRIAVIDFAPHATLPDDLSRITVHTSSNLGRVSDGVLQRNPETAGLRLAFSFDPGAAETMELRAQLLVAGRRVSEVWLYRWTA